MVINIYICASLVDELRNGDTGLDYSNEFFNRLQTQGVGLSYYCTL